MVTLSKEAWKARIARGKVRSEQRPHTHLVPVKHEPSPAKDSAYARDLVTNGDRAGLTIVERRALDYMDAKLKALGGSDSVAPKATGCDSLGKEE